MSEAFRHIESARTIVFGPTALADSAELIGEGYTLLSTPRAAASAPGVLERAATLVEVPAGQVDAVAAQLRGTVTGGRLVALGGGRVIDVAKALAAADPPREVVAIPTSLSAAEMTAVHRHAQGVSPGTPRVRPAVVINDRQLSASLPAEALAASSANALGHAITALASDRTTAISMAVAGEAIQRLVGDWSGAEPDLVRRWRSGRCWRAGRSITAASVCTTRWLRAPCVSLRSSTARRTPRCYRPRSGRSAPVGPRNSSGLMRSSV